MGKDKKIIVTIPEDFNKQLMLYLVETKIAGTIKETNKADLIIKFARIGFIHENQQSNSESHE